MKIFYSIVFTVAIIAIITFGLKRSNAFFRQNNALGEVNYLTPKTEEQQDTAAKVDSLRKASPIQEAYQESELVHVSEK